MVMSTLPRRALVGLVRGYRVLLSPWLGNTCRFEPSCSAYSIDALTKHGATAGTYLTLHRLARCQPLCEGGHDPVPERMPSLFRRLVTAAPGGSSSTSIDKTSP